MYALNVSLQRETLQLLYPVRLYIKYAALRKSEGSWTKEKGTTEKCDPIVRISAQKKIINNGELLAVNFLSSGFN